MPRHDDSPLTDRQAEVLNFLWSHTLDKGYQPSLREIAAAIDVVSMTAVQAHLTALARKGFIAVPERESRAIRFLLTPDREVFRGLTHKRAART